MVYVSEQPLFDFSRKEDCAGWSPVDDVVMGGCSHSTVSFDPGALVFCGELSLDNGGGFASIRSPLREFNLSSATALVLRVTGDGKTYKVGLRLSEKFDAPVYQASFIAPAEETKDVYIPYNELEPRYHGRSLDVAPPFEPQRVRSVGLLIADRQSGPFSLRVESIIAR